MVYYSGVNSGVWSITMVYYSGVWSITLLISWFPLKVDTAPQSVHSDERPALIAHRDAVIMIITVTAHAPSGSKQCWRGRVGGFDTF